MTSAAAFMATAALRAHPGYHLVKLEKMQLFGGVCLDAQVDTDRIDEDMWQTWLRLLALPSSPTAPSARQTPAPRAPQT